MVPVLGYDPWAIKVPGGIAHTQWRTTLTGESPTSSSTTHAAVLVRQVDKAQPKRPAYAAVRAGPSRTVSLRGWQLFRSSDDGRERKAQR
jgi:hypothetical protein